MSFVHLHCHTEYSLLDGFSNIKKLVARAKALGMPALAITDHGAMHGVIDFFSAATEAGIKPIIGLEAYLAPRRMTDKESALDKKPFHLLLLAQNQTGYANLLKIASAAQLEGFYYYPRIDREFLAAHSAGLICTTGCLAAEVPRLLTDGRADEARQRLDWYYEVFGPERFFFELQHHDIPELRTLNKSLLELGPRYQARYLATNDVHYINPEDARLQDIMLAIQTGARLDDAKRMRMSGQDYYLRTPAEMQALFAETPGALSNTLLVAEMCEVNLKTKGYHLPQFPVPAGHTAESYLRALCEAGLTKRYGARAQDPAVRQRLEYELGVIVNMGFAAYFLIVWDLCRYASANNIWYNARGSAAGSMVAYVLEITLVEPLEHGLIFERFLNPSRISMPDIDLDFQDDLRYRLLEYCANKYGSDKVAQIITFGTLGARAAIRDVGRVMGVPLKAVDQIAKTVPNIPGKPVTIKDVVAENADLQKMLAEGVTYRDGAEEASLPADKVRDLVETASQLEGVVRNVGTHAAGVVVADQDITAYLPLHRPTSNTDDTPIKTVTQFEMGILEKLGMLKVDFLGLATLTVMQRACALIQQRHGKTYTLNNIPTDDKKAYDLMGKGHTAGVFQVEGGGMTRYLVQMKPRTLDNLIAMISLYRPGPLEFIPNYIRRMHGEETVEYRHPALEPIFKDTYGIPVYQEQIMRAAVDLAGYSMSESDDLRKAIAKKQKENLLKHQQKFIAGAVERGIPPAAAEGIFHDWEEFARYGFNKCVTGDTEIVDADTGQLVPVSALHTGQATLTHTLTMNEATLKLQRGRVVAVMANGVQPVYRLTTALGHTITATANHPFYTFAGWRWLGALQPGDRVAVARRLPVAGQATWPDHEVVVLGHLLAEGNLCHPHSVYFYSQSADQVQDFINAANCFANVNCSAQNHKGTFSVYARRANRHHSSGIMLWAEKHALLGKTAHNKEIPVAALQLSQRQLGLLLSRMWEGDGHIDLKGRYLFYATASPRLAYQVQHVLLRLGIVSRLRQVKFKYRDGRLGYQVFVTGHDNLAQFNQVVGAFFVSETRRAHINSLAQTSAEARSTKDVVPVQVKTLVREAKHKAGVSWLAMRAATGLAPREFYPTTTESKKGFSRHTIARAATYFEDAALSRLAHSDVYWDEVVSITPLGDQPTYDLEIAEHHNFVANHLVVHNSHAADYGVIAAQTAYLKAHYPAEYMAALLSVTRNDTDKVAAYMDECRSMGIQVLPPDLNASGLDFTIEDRPSAGPAIRFGLGAVKNVGEGPVTALTQARASGGRFQSLDDLCQRVDLRQVGKRALECLIKVGALDSIHPRRKQLLDSVDKLIQISAHHFRAEPAGQFSLFGESVAVTARVQLEKDAGDFDEKTKREYEKELIGLHLTPHPEYAKLDSWRDHITARKTDLTEALHGKNVVMAGIVVSMRTHQTKKGDAMGFATIEDPTGNQELVFFPKAWQAHQGKLKEGAAILVRGKVDAQNTSLIKLLVDDVTDESNVLTAAPATTRATQAVAFGEYPEDPPLSLAEAPADYEAAHFAEVTAPPDMPDDLPPPPDDWPPAPAPASVTAPPQATPPNAPQYAPQQAPPRPRTARLTFRANGDLAAETRKLRQAYDLLCATPGADAFEFIIIENGKTHRVKYGRRVLVNDDVVASLRRLLGAEAIQLDK